MRKEGDNKAITMSKHIGMKCLCMYYDCVIKRVRLHTSPPTKHGCLHLQALDWLLNQLAAEATPQSRKTDILMDDSVDVRKQPQVLFYEAIMRQFPQ